MTTEHRRLAILRHLAECNGYASNASILLDVVNGVGVPTSLDQLATTLAWLDEQELAYLSGNEVVTIAEATTRGVEVAMGRVRHPGVKVPSARA